jgi:putative hydrolase of the HAD superfamily
MLHDLQVLCFDLDDTFWDVRQVLDRAEQRVAAFLALRYPRLAQRYTRADLLAARQRLAAAEPALAHDMTWLRTETMRRLAVAEGYPDAAGAEAFDVFIVARNEVELFPDVRPALERLSARFRLATLSNGNADLHRIGLAPLFTVMLNAAGVRKRLLRSRANSIAIRRGCCMSVTTRTPTCSAHARPACARPG